uniref:Transcription factor VOZ1 isoform X2 n=1 Tax=Elaeis guineensis var. tenera TaxID=51953 RepID=A0A8N4EXR8_ELAGV|nr:transcription factor VOZ1 isoform X2 [Elaeis guineensis]
MLQACECETEQIRPVKESNKSPSLPPRFPQPQVPAKLALRGFQSPSKSTSSRLSSSSILLSPLSVPPNPAFLPLLPIQIALLRYIGRVSERNQGGLGEGFGLGLVGRKWEKVRRPYVGRRPTSSSKTRPRTGWMTFRGCSATSSPPRCSASGRPSLTSPLRFLFPQLPSETLRLLQLSEEEDDATSKLALPAPGKAKAEPLDVPEPYVEEIQGGETAVFQEDYYVNQELTEHEFLYGERYKSNLHAGTDHAIINCLDRTAHLDYQQFSLHQELHHNVYLNTNSSEQNGEDVLPHMSDLLPTICPPPSAFLGPKCALWDCPRPAQGSEWCQDYCSSFHATLALNEGPPGMAPVLRPGGVDLKDSPLFAALCAKTQGKNVGILVCEGAATAKSPWNVPELFDLSVLEGESIREWLFFDKPRRAFESGNRKQRSLPDYSGRGWHESRKQVMKECGGSKRSYYMDPQPLTHFEWHLYEYEISNCDDLALYKLEFKFVDAKKSSRAKLTGTSLVDLQRQMGRLNAENSVDNKKNTKSRTKANQKGIAESMYSSPHIANQKENVLNFYHASDQMVSLNENSAYGPSFQYVYSVEKDCYGT